MKGGSAFPSPIVALSMPLSSSFPDPNAMPFSTSPGCFSERGRSIVLATLPQIGMAAGTASFLSLAVPSKMKKHDTIDRPLRWGLPFSPSTELPNVEAQLAR